MNATNAQTAIRNAVETYAASLGVTASEAVQLYRENESTRDAIAALVLAQASKTALRNIAQ